MSEYQYYEFAAIDRPLGRAEMAELRAVSSRAQISPSSFVNHYEWGDLKADPADWTRRHFDAFVYTACWCSCRLALRVPLDVFRRAELEAFVVRHALDVDKTSAHWIIHWSLYESENYDRFGTEDGSGWMQRLLPLRDELLRGDLRPLYLGWLAGAGELSGDEAEPEVPTGLAKQGPSCCSTAWEVHGHSRRPGKSPRGSCGEEREPGSWQQALEIGVETGHMLTLMGGGGGQPGIGNVIRSERLVGAQPAQRWPLGAQLGLFHARRAQQRIDKTQRFGHRRRLDEYPRMRHQPQEAGNHHGLQFQWRSLAR